MVPSKDRYDRDLPEEKVRFWQNKVRALFIKWFGGGTTGSQRTIRERDRWGDFDTQSGTIISEPSLHIESYCTRDVFRRRLGDVRSLAKEIGRDLDQQTAGWFENNDYCEKELS